MIQTLEDMLRACILDFQESWSKYLPVVEFVYNNSYQPAPEMAPYEASHSRKCRSLVYWDEMGEIKFMGLYLIREIAEVVNKSGTEY